MCNMIVAIDQYGRIGRDDKLLWHCPEDLKHFKDLTTGKIIIIGKRTLEGIGRMLPKREHIVVGRDFHSSELIKELQKSDKFTAIHISGLDEFLVDIAEDVDSAWVVGGAGVYAYFMPYVRRLVISHIELYDEHNPPQFGDVYFPYIDLRDASTVNVLDVKEINDRNSGVKTLRIVEYLFE